MNDMLSWMGLLGDPTRLRLLHLLERHELGVAELCDIVQAPQSTVSRHLRILGERGWARGRRDGTTNLYRMVAQELTAPARKFWAVVRQQSLDSTAVRQDELRLSRLLRQRRADTEQFFAGTATRWDQLRTQYYGRCFEQEAMLALLPGHWVVADLGCGPGQLAVALAGSVGKVIGVDSAPAMLKAAQQHVSDLDNVELRRGDLEALPIDDQLCDAAILSLVLTYVDHPPIVLREAVRILKPAGQLVVVDLLEHDRDDFRRRMGQRWPGFDIENLRNMMVDVGLCDLHIRPLPPEPNVKGPALMLAAGRVIGEERTGK